MVLDQFIPGFLQLLPMNPHLFIFRSDLCSNEHETLPEDKTFIKGESFIGDSDTAISLENDR